MDNPTRTLQFIKKYIDEHEYPPTIREIQEGLGASSTSLIGLYLDKLEIKGLIKRHKGIARGIVLIPQDQLKIGV